MTGFGQAEDRNGRHAVSVVMRGVNHRFLDLALRLREDYRASEGPLREQLQAGVSRGRVEMAVEVTSLENRRAEVTVDADVVRALHAAIADLASQGILSPSLQLGDLARLPEAVRVRVPPEVWDAEDQRLALDVAARALEQFLASRSLEGAKLQVILSERLTSLAQIRERLTERRRVAAGELAANLQQRIEELLGGRGLDEDRLAQEVALLVDRSDIAEELDRLGSHLEHFHSVMAEPGSIGKRLDFLTQEIFRELNTLGSKCRDATMTRWVLDAKVLCEQLREQVQNVE
ncbi:MAG TPA: YicC/YloC family endoribonuclease [Kofleriaceae bacterium]|jgi:uncharacterized protein (TIGR00255 family)